MTYTDNCPKLKIAVPDTISYYIEIYRLKTCALQGQCLHRGCTSTRHHAPQAHGLRTQACGGSAMSLASLRRAPHGCPQEGMQPTGRMVVSPSISIQSLVCASGLFLLH